MAGAEGTQDFSSFATTDDPTWDNWRTSPKNKHTMVFATITGVRVDKLTNVPIFFLKKTVGRRS
jgi:hypothetical protein